MNAISKYLEDAVDHLSAAFSLVSEEARKQEQWQATLFAAIGIEKLLKYVLEQINPALVLKSPDHDSIIVSSYLERVTAKDRIPELKKKSSLDVITLKNSVQRAALFSQAVAHHSQFIHALADARDIAAHRPWSETNQNRIRVMLCRDLYQAVSEISADAQLDAEMFLGNSAHRVAALSQKIAREENLYAAMADKLGAHRAMWADREGRQELVASIRQLTMVRLNVERESFACKCPACGNMAMAFFEPDIDYDRAEGDRVALANVVGLSVVGTTSPRFQ